MPPVPPSPPFGNNVKDAMSRAGIGSQQELADRMGKFKGQVSGWMNAEQPNVELDTLFAFAKVLGVPIDDLLVGVDAEYDAMRRRVRPPDRLSELWARVPPEPRRQLWRLLLALSGEPIERHDAPPDPGSGPASSLDPLPTGQ